LADSNRGVIMVMYDLPSVSAKERRDAAAFRKRLLKSGFCMLQESIYVRLLRNRENGNREAVALSSAAPPNSDITVLVLTLEAFRSMTRVSGNAFNLSLFADDFIVI